MWEEEVVMPPQGQEHQSKCLRGHQTLVCALTDRSHTVTQRIKVFLTKGEPNAEVLQDALQRCGYKQCCELHTTQGAWVRQGLY